MSLNYSSIVLDRFFNPRHVGSLAEASGIGEVGTFGEGNFVRLFITVEKDKITKATFRCFTCPVAVAAVDMVAELVVGMMLEEAKKLTPEELSVALGGIPEEKMSRCRYAVSAVRNAIKDCRAKENRNRREV